MESRVLGVAAASAVLLATLAVDLDRGRMAEQMARMWGEGCRALS
jgi:hypothetical protein